MVSRELASTALGFLHRPIRVAFVGHRPNQLPPESLAQVRAAIDTALDALEAAGKEAASRGVKFVLRTALAEGADRMAAEAALERGWALEAPLPFSIERYEQDFATPESVAALQALLKQASKVRPSPQFDTQPEAGYAAAGRAVIKGVDAALIVWNGEEGKGPGGTADVAARVLEAGAPVIWIGVGDRQRPKLLAPDEAVARRGRRATYMCGALAARFERTERPAALRADPAP